ncbi:putative ABC transport system permease protein [Anaerovirgula multivorans]|uniref:Putative ABC transport system permease protein n=1 Tax=Anaerovirgula multivorans TaxID=312168 RepID=A0A239IC64_9FIRM|nr:ABC transporter permease [Anaerovirgula multivorans]SNS91135.1 putative ABC transport system permease protein [Anaerovirgula multivorans]
MKLLLNLVRKDFKRNRVITTALAVFLILSALLMAGGLRVTGTMISSLNGLNELAVPPEYLQMHKGTYDREAFESFVETHDYIKDSQIVKMLNISNANIIYQGETLEKYLMDNGFVVQNERFDFLLNMDNEIAFLQEGEIGVPVYYVEELGIQVGDVITLHQGDYRKELIVSTIIRDASMNAALASSKRLLISQTDIDEISLHMGEWEYCFEFLLENGTATAVLEKDYMDAGMPSNGATVTGSLLRMLNNLSHGLVAFIIIAISILLIMIAVLCLSYIIRATMAEENYTIGEMKAIGFPRKAIAKLYQMKYIMLVLVAGVIGYLAAIPFGDFFSSSVIMYCGYGTDEWMKWVFPFIGVILLSVIVMLRCHKIIGRNLNSTVVGLMRGEEKIEKEGHYSLPSSGLKHPNLTIAFGELKCKWKEYLVIFLVFVFSSFLILLPMNMKSTVENPSFMTYMGVGESDIRIDIQYSEKLAEQKDAAQSYLENDAEIDKYAIYQNGYVQLQNADGEWEYIRVENGDASVFPLEYLQGRAPNDRKEMALSYLSASELRKEVGDSLTVIYQGEELLFTLCGIYQDITYGGKTAKAAIDFAEIDVEVYIIYLNVRDGVRIEEKTDELRSILTDSKITPISEFVSQTLGGIMDNMSLVEGTAIMISLLLIMLITVMILQLITAREHSAIAIKKAIGFSNRDIRIQFGIRILMIQFVAIFAGTVLANFLGEVIFGWMLSSMGVSKITMLVEPITAYLLSPAVQLLVVLITVIVGTKVVRNYHIRNQIIE